MPDVTSVTIASSESAHDTCLRRPLRACPCISSCNEQVMSSIIKPIFAGASKAIPSVFTMFGWFMFFIEPSFSSASASCSPSPERTSAILTAHGRPPSSFSVASATVPNAPLAKVVWVNEIVSHGTTTRPSLCCL